MKIIISLIVTLFLSASDILSQDFNLKIEPYVFEDSEGEKIDAELGTFTVPENREKTGGKQINLNFVRFKSTSPNPGYPIIYLAGGPGGSGIQTARGSRFDLFMKMRGIGDVIAFDQRGTGMSDGLPAYNGYYLVDLSQVMTEESAEKAIAEEVVKMEKYFEAEGHDLSGYNSRESAHDINDLRKALGAEKMNIWGISYGSHLALTTLKEHDDQVHKMIIAGVEGYDHTVKLPSDQQELLEKIDQLLKDNPETRKLYPDFLGDLEKLLRKVDENPVYIKTKNPLAGELMEMQLGKLDLQMLFAWYLGGPDNFKDLPLHVKQMLEGNFSAIEDVAIYTRAGRLSGMSIGMDVASGISPERRRRIKKEAGETLLGDAINFPYLIQQKALSHLDLGDSFREPFVSDVPVFCISGTLDGRTSVKNADFTLETLKNGHHLVIEGAGHSDPLFLSSPKIGELMIDFMNGENIGVQRITLAPMKFDLE